MRREPRAVGTRPENWEEILTLKEVAAYLRLTTKSIYRMAQGARIPAFKAHSVWRFRRKDIDAWIEARMNVMRTGTSQPGPKNATRRTTASPTKGKPSSSASRSSRHR